MSPYAARQLAAVRRHRLVEVVRIALHIEVVHVLAHVVDVESELARELMADARRHLNAVRRLHVVLDQNRRRRSGLSGDHARAQHGRIFRARISKVVHAPRRVLALLESDEARHAVVDDAEPAADERPIPLRRIPRERNARREIAELVLAIARVEVVLELGDVLENRIPAHGTVYLLFIVLNSASCRTPNDSVKSSVMCHSSLM